MSTSPSTPTQLAAADDLTIEIVLDVPPRRRRRIVWPLVAIGLALVVAVGTWLVLTRTDSDPVVLSNGDATALLQAEKAALASTVHQQSELPTRWREAATLVDEKRQLYDRHDGIPTTATTAGDDQARLHAEKEQLLARSGTRGDGSSPD